MFFRQKHANLLSFILFIAPLFILFSLASLADTTKARSQIIIGEVSYGKIENLPAHAVLTVQLIDIGKANNSHEIVAEETKEVNARNPIPYRLELMAAHFQNGHNYALQARITVGDTLWFVSDQRYPVTINKDESYKLRLAAVKQNMDNNGEATDNLFGHIWHAQDIFGQKVISNTLLTMKIDVKSSSSPTELMKTYEVSGSSGCNQYRTKVAQNDHNNQLSFQAPSLTYLACPSEITAQENRYMEVFTKARSYEFDDIGRLFFKDGQEKVIASFVPEL